MLWCRGVDKLRQAPELVLAVFLHMLRGSSISALTTVTFLAYARHVFWSGMGLMSSSLCLSCCLRRADAAGGDER